MTRPERDAAVRRLLFRSLLIQGMWNPRDLLGSGVSWALGDPATADDPPSPFNSHPYLSGVALGSVTRARIDGGFPPETELRFRSALRAPLGALGDALVWAGWLPFLLLLSMGLVLLGAPPVPVVVGFLVVHNVLHVALRRWGVRLGLEHGMRVGAALGTSPLRPLGDRFRQGVVVLAGFVAAVAALRGGGELVQGWGAVTGLVSGSLAFVALGYLFAGRLPVTTPLRVALILLGVGWIAAGLAGR
jgi:mannose PTS system EIID component